MKNDKAHSNKDCLRVDDEDVQEAVKFFISEKHWLANEWAGAYYDLAIQALKAYRPSGQLAEDTAEEGSPDVREKRTSGGETNDNPDKLPCKWCSGRDSEDFETAGVVEDEDDGGWWWQDFTANYCPNCGRELRTSMSLPKGDKND